MNRNNEVLHEQLIISLQLGPDSFWCLKLGYAADAVLCIYSVRPIALQMEQSFPLAASRGIILCLAHVASFFF